MPINFRITPLMMRSLLQVETVRERVGHLPLTPSVLASLREMARIYTTHYSTRIEGNRLRPDEIAEVLKKDWWITEDEREVRGYYTALRQVEEWGLAQEVITENTVKTIHARVMSVGRATPYRDGQNVIRDSRTKAIIYMPPEAKDVPELMRALVHWVGGSQEMPVPIVAAVAHYQFATIHPYYDGNGRTARLLTTLILHLGGYGLKGLYSLEEYYAQNLSAYSAA